MSETMQRVNARVVGISLAAALGGFLFGFDTAVINGAVDALRHAFGLSAAETGFAVSCALLGSAAGAWYAGRLADRFGRVRTMQIAAVLLAVLRRPLLPPARSLGSVAVVTFGSVVGFPLLTAHALTVTIQQFIPAAALIFPISGRRQSACTRKLWRRN